MVAFNLDEKKRNPAVICASPKLYLLRISNLVTPTQYDISVINV